MPIRFRCAYCNQLMAIARRKAGTVVRCPTCAGQVVVPATDAVPDGPDPAKEPKPADGGVFERSDFDQVFQSPAAPPPPTRQPGFALGPEPASGPAGPAYHVERSPFAVPSTAGPLRRPPGLVLTPGKGLLFLLLVAALLGLAFYIGFLVGQSA
jgi:hypothetical protein